MLGLIIRGAHVENPQGVSETGLGIQRDLGEDLEYRGYLIMTILRGKAIEEDGRLV